MTAAEFLEKVAAIEGANPTHPMLPLFRAGQSATTEILVNLELRKIRKTGVSSVAPALMGDHHAKKPTEKSENGDEPEDKSDDPDDPILQNLRRELGGFFGERAALSNRIFDAKTKSERADISDEIQMVQRKIMHKMRDIRAYKLHGTVADKDNSKYPVPRDPFELSGLINSLRASISRKKSELELLWAQGMEKPAVARKIEKAEDKLRDLKTHLEYAQAEKALAVQPAGV